MKKTTWENAKTHGNSNFANEKTHIVSKNNQLFIKNKTCIAWYIKQIFKEKGT